MPQRSGLERDDLTHSSARVEVVYPWSLRGSWFVVGNTVLEVGLNWTCTSRSGLEPRLVHFVWAIWALTAITPLARASRAQVELRKILPN